MKKFLLAALIGSFALTPAFGAKDADKEKKDPAEVFKTLDKDSDGKLTFEEFKGKRDEEKARKQFDAKDKDKDGNLTLEEFKATKKKKDAK